MTMRVLVAIDGSEQAELAVDLVANVSWPAGSQIVVAEAVESGDGLFGGPWLALAMVQTDRIEAEIRDQAHRTVHGSVAGRHECPSCRTTDPVAARLTRVYGQASASVVRWSVTRRRPIGEGSGS